MKHNYCLQPIVRHIIVLVHITSPIDASRLIVLSRGGPALAVGCKQVGWIREGQIMREDLLQWDTIEICSFTACIVPLVYFLDGIFGHGGK